MENPSRVKVSRLPVLPEPLPADVQTLFAERLAKNPPAAIAATKSLVYQAATTPTRQQLDAEEHKIITTMHTDDFRVAVKKFTSKSK